MSDGSKSARPAGANENADTIFFVSDAHFGVGREEIELPRIRRFVEFLRFAGEHARSVYIVGDLFDFWFEYRQVLPKTHVLIFTEIAALREKGVDVTYIAGNHDYWLGDFFPRTLGIRTSEEPIHLETQGRRIYLTHGDDLTAGHDHGYRFLRSLARSKLAIGIYHWIHPDIGIPFARWASNTSRGYSTARKFVLNQTVERAILGKLDEGFDAVVMGHLHYADQLQYENGECLMLGDWIQAFTYGVLEGGKLTIREFGSGEGR